MNAKRQTLEKRMAELGPSKALARFLSKYGNENTKCSYTVELTLYLRWLRDEQGVTMTPDQLIIDNLKAVFKSEAVDVAAKRKHTDWLNSYTNVYLLEQGYSESKRHVASNAIKMFYERNDSALFGDYSLASQPLEEPAPALFPEDVRKVLLSMNPRARAPLVLAWQSGIEINRLLALDFSRVGTAPLKIPLLGRKGHKKGYWTYAGSDSVDLLKILGGRGFPTYESIADQFRTAAVRLGAQGLLRNADRRSYHCHALRHSFSTECKAAGVDPEVREFWLGHISGIAYVYQHQEIHAEDILDEYEKVEPLVSLNQDEASIRRSYEERERTLKNGFEDRLARLEREIEERLHNS